MDFDYIKEQIRAKNRAIGQETLDTIKRGSYVFGEDINVDIKTLSDEAIKNTKVYTPEELVELPFDERPEYTTYFSINVNNLGTLETAHQLHTQGVKDIVCLNFASAIYVGGSFLQGSLTQEEDLCRKSSLYPCLEKATEYYKANIELKSHLYTDHIIYSPNVPVFRANNFDWLSMPFPVSIITAPAPMTRLINREEPDSIDKIASTIFLRAEKILKLAAFHKHKTIILGAWGCGAFGNSPFLVASIFQSLFRKRFKNAFDHVIFAILDPEKTHVNTQAFKAAFPDIGANL